jgi:hypothetical protein
MLYKRKLGKLYCPHLSTKRGKGKQRPRQEDKLNAHHHHSRQTCTLHTMNERERDKTSSAASLSFLAAIAGRSVYGNLTDHLFFLSLHSANLYFLTL